MSAPLACLQLWKSRSDAGQSADRCPAEEITKIRRNVLNVLMTVSKPKADPNPLTGIKRLALHRAVAAGLHRENGAVPELVASKLLGRDLPRVEVLRLKGATNSANTTSAGWAAELAEQDVREMVREIEYTSVLAQLMSLEGVKTTFVGFESLTYPIQALSNRGALKSSWVEQGAPIPVKAASFGSSTIWRFKLAAISTMSEELIQLSNPNILSVVENMLRTDLAESLDDFAFNSTYLQTPAVAPKYLTNGAPEQASAGNSLTQVTTDWRHLKAEAIRLRMSDSVVCMNSNNWTGLQMVNGTVGAFPLRNEVANGSLFGLPILHLPFFPTADVTIIDAGHTRVVTDPT